MYIQVSCHWLAYGFWKSLLGGEWDVVSGQQCLLHTHFLCSPPRRTEVVFIWFPNRIFILFCLHPTTKRKQHPHCAFFSQLESCSSTFPWDSSSATKCFISQQDKLGCKHRPHKLNFLGTASQISSCRDVDLFLSAKDYTLKPLLTVQVKLQTGGWGWGRGWGPSQCMDQRQECISCHCLKALEFLPDYVWFSDLKRKKTRRLYAFLTVSRFQKFKEASEIMRSGWCWLLWFSQLSNFPCLSK